MNRCIHTFRLATGELGEVREVIAPDADHRDTILTLLAHKGGVWENHLTAALDGRTDDLETRWYLGLVDGRAVADAMLVERHGVAILGHVYTVEAFRRRGICRAVLSAMMEAFKGRDGRSIILGTGFESVAYRIYESFGFRSLRGGLMAWYATGRSEFEVEWFAPGPGYTREAQWEHWPLVASLATFAEASGLRSVAWGMRDIANLEWPYCHYMAHRAEPGYTGVVSQTETGAVVAVATCVPFRIGETGEAWPNVWLVDAFAHPLHTFKMTESLARLSLPPGKAIAFAADSDAERRSAFSDAGFVQEGRLRDTLSVGSVTSDVAVYGRVVGPSASQLQYWS